MENSTFDVHFIFGLDLLLFLFFNYHHFIIKYSNQYCLNSLQLFSKAAYLLHFFEEFFILQFNDLHLTSDMIVKSIIILVIYLISYLFSMIFQNVQQFNSNFIQSWINFSYELIINSINLVFLMNLTTTMLDYSLISINCLNLNDLKQ